jgi:2-dehydropantoate 2-reductase
MVETKTMRIAVMGAGGQGGLFGSLLSQVGHEVTFIARGRNLEALKKNGLTIKSSVFNNTTIQVNATDQLEVVGEVDLVLFCVKNYDLDEAVEQIKPMIGPETIVLTIQNGVEAPDRVGNVIGPEHVLPGVSITNAHLEAPGVVNHLGGKNLVFGEFSGEITPRVLKLEKAFKETGLDVVASEDIKGRLWQKLSTLCGLHGVICLTRSSIGTVRDHEDTWGLLRNVILEAASVALAEDVMITEEEVDATLESISRMPPGVKPSMMVDLEAGRRIELDTFNGAIVRFGKKHGVDTPLNYVIYSALKPYENGTPTIQAHN